MLPQCLEEYKGTVHDKTYLFQIFNLITEKTNKNWNEFSFFIVELMRKSLFLIIQLDVL